jgi:hypothetical protein
MHHKTVNQVFNQYNLIAKNKFEKYSFHLIDTGGIELGDGAFNEEIKMMRMYLRLAKRD